MPSCGSSDGGADRRAQHWDLREQSHEVPHEPNRDQEYHRRDFYSATQAQRFLTLLGLTQNVLRLGRHLLQPVKYGLLRYQAFLVWQDVVYAEGMVPSGGQYVPFDVLLVTLTTPERRFIRCPS